MIKEGQLENENLIDIEQEDVEQLNNLTQWTAFLQTTRALFTKAKNSSIILLTRW